MATHVHDDDGDEDGVSSAVAARAGAPAFLDCIKADDRVKSLSLPAPTPTLWQQIDGQKHAVEVP